MKFSASFGAERVMAGAVSWLCAWRVTNPSLPVVGSVAGLWQPGKWQGLHHEVQERGSQMETEPPLLSSPCCCSPMHSCDTPMMRGRWLRGALSKAAVLLWACFILEIF